MLLKLGSTMDNAAVKDNTNISLDEYIRMNPVIKSIKKRISPPSQQWRLGRNGPRGLKRLHRTGPLRPYPNRPHMGPRADDGIPNLVLKRYRFLPPQSVFHRLGWNPLFSMARQKLYRARAFLNRRRYNNFPQRRQPWQPNPWGWRRFGMQRPHPWSNWPRQQSMWRKRSWGQRGGNQRQAYNFVQPQQSAQELIRAQRMQNQQNKIKNQNMWEQRQNTSQYSNQRQMSSTFSDQIPNNFPRPSVFYPPDNDQPASSSGHYRIERDNYPPPPNIRPPSPVGSIASTFSRTRSSINPFAPADQPPPLTNPLRSAATSSGYLMPNTINLSCTQRFGPRNSPYQTSMVVE